LFKSLYPDVGYYFDFKAAAITSISHDKKMFQLILKQDLNQSLVSGMCFSGHYDFDDKTVLTLITIKK
jgi:4'-phosphopantetheinyl transferase EntD